MNLEKKKGCIPRKKVPGFQILLLILALLSIIPILIELNFFDKFKYVRYLPQMNQYILMAHKINVWLRTFQCVGTFVACIFYVTQKIVYINVTACIINIATMFMLINYELSDPGQPNRANQWQTDVERYGYSPVFLYSVNLLFPILLAVGCLLLREETGLILVDNDQLAFAEEYHHGEGKQLKLYQLKHSKAKATK